MFFTGSGCRVVRPALLAVAAVWCALDFGQSPRILDASTHVMSKRLSDELMSKLRTHTCQNTCQTNVRTEVRNQGSLEHMSAGTFAGTNCKNKSRNTDRTSARTHLRTEVRPQMSKHISEHTPSCQKYILQHIPEEKICRISCQTSRPNVTTHAKTIVKKRIKKRSVFTSRDPHNDHYISIRYNKKVVHIIRPHLFLFYSKIF